MLRYIVLLLICALSGRCPAPQAQTSSGIWASIEPTAKLHTGSVVGLHAVTENILLSVGADKTIRFWKIEGGAPRPAGRIYRLAGGPGFVGRPEKSAYRNGTIIVITRGQPSTATDRPNRNKFYVHRLTVSNNKEIPSIEDKLKVTELPLSTADFAQAGSVAEIASCDVAEGGEVAVLFNGGGFSLIPREFGGEVRKGVAPKRGQRQYSDWKAIAVSPDATKLAIGGGNGLAVFQTADMSTSSNGPKPYIDLSNQPISTVRWEDELMVGEGKAVFRLGGKNLEKMESPSEGQIQRLAKGGLVNLGQSGIVADSIGAKSYCFAFGSRIAFCDGSALRSVGTFDPGHSLIGWSGSRVVAKFNSYRGNPSVGDFDLPLPQICFLTSLEELRCSAGLQPDLDQAAWGERIEVDTKSKDLFQVGGTQLRWDMDTHSYRVKGNREGDILLRGAGEEFPESVAAGKEGEVAILGADGLLRVWDTSMTPVPDGQQRCLDPKWYILVTPTDPFKPPSGTGSDAASSFAKFSWAVWDVTTNKTGFGNGGDSILGFLLNRNQTELAEWVPLGQALGKSQTLSAKVGKSIETTFVPSVLDVGGAEYEGLDSQGRRIYRALPGRYQNLSALVSSPKLAAMRDPVTRARVNLSAKDVRPVDGGNITSGSELAINFGIPSMGASLVEFEVEGNGEFGRTEKIIVRSSEVGDSTAMPTYVVSIGVNEYGDRTVSNLACAVNDASAVSDAFKANGFLPVEFDVPISSADSVRNAIRAAREKIAKSGGNLIVFISSHGHVDQNGVGYMVLPAGTDGKAKLEGIKWTDILDEIAASGANNSLLIVDACYSGTAVVNATMSKGSLESSLSDSGRVSGQVARFNQISIITSSSPEQTSQEGEGESGKKNGVFTSALLALLNGSEAHLSINNFSTKINGANWISVDTLLNAIRLTLPARVRDFVSKANEKAQFKELADRIAPVMQNPEGYVANPFFYIGKIPSAGSTPGSNLLRSARVSSRAGRSSALSRNR